MSTELVGHDIRELHAGDLDALLALDAHLHETDEPLPERAVVESV